MVRLIVQFFGLLVITLSISACDKDFFKKLFAPPESSAAPNTSSSMLGSQGNSSVNHEASSENSNAFSSSTLSSDFASSSADSTNTAASNSNASSSAASSTVAGASSSTAISSVPANGLTEAENLFQSLCSECHNLQTQMPFVIGTNLSLAELIMIINDTMPFNNSEACVGDCAEQLAFFIEATYSTAP
jgi:hypothetical protein